MTAIWEVNYDDISLWWLVLFIVIAIVIVAIVMWLVTAGFDRRIMKEGSERNRRVLEDGLRREDERARAAEEARRQAAAYSPGDSHTAATAS
jgi:hypothetical protein